MKKKFVGQQAIEFILISSLVLLGSLVMLLSFSKKLNSFFSSDSAVAIQSKLTAARINSTNDVNYTQNFSSTIAAPVSIYTDPSLSQYNVKQNSDGSVSFTVNSQTVTLPVSVLQLQDTVMQTTGSAGSAELIKEIANMIQTYKSEYPYSSVPISLSFGKGNRVDSENPSASNYIGTASANSVTIKTGKHVTILQQDQQCNGSSCAFSGLYKIKGTLDSLNNLNNANVTSKLLDGSSMQGTLNGKVDTTSGIKITDANFAFNNASWSYDWNFDCSATDKQFKV